MLLGVGLARVNRELELQQIREAGELGLLGTDTPERFSGLVRDKIVFFGNLQQKGESARHRVRLHVRGIHTFAAPPADWMVYR